MPTIERHPLTLVITTGRSGTLFLCNTFKEAFADQNAWISHEYLDANEALPGIFHRCYDDDTKAHLRDDTPVGALLERWKDLTPTSPVVDFGWTLRHVVPLAHDCFGERLRVLFIHRHPIEVAGSFTNMGAFTDVKSKNWALEPTHPRAMFPGYTSNWDQMSAFEKCLYNWLEVVAYGREVKREFPGIRMLEVRSEDLFRKEDVLEEIAAFAGLFSGRKVDASKSKHSQKPYNLERHPVGEEWKKYNEMPDVIQCATELGYDMEFETVGKLVQKYQLRGWASKLRFFSGYWRLGVIRRKLLEAIAPRS